MHRIRLLLSVVLRHARFIVLNCLVISALAIVVSFLLPQRFTATAQILPPPEDDILGMSSLLGGGLSAGRLGRLGLGGMLDATSPSDLMVGILSSRSVMERVAARCSIAEYYRIRQPSPEKAVKQLDQLVDLFVSDEGIVSISTSAKTRELAAMVSNTLVDELDVFLRTSDVNRGRSIRLFLERQLSGAARELREAQDSLEALQVRHRILSIDDEIEAAVDAYALLQSQLLGRLVTLGAWGDVSEADNPRVVSLRREIAALRGRLREMEGGGSGRGFGAGFSVALEGLPAVSAEYVRRYRDFRVSEEAYEMLIQQYEYAKILEARDTPAIAILDRAVPPERRSFPRRAQIVLVVFLFSLAVGIARAFVSDYFARTRSERPDEYEGWLSLRGQLQDTLGGSVQAIRRKKSRRDGSRAHR